MFKIGDFSQLCRVPVSALRYYADTGLLAPAHIDSFTGYRYYSLDQLPRLNRILALKDLGFSLEQVKQLLADDLSFAQLQGMLMLRQAEIEREIEDEQARLARVAARLNQIAQEGKMPEQEVILKTLDPLRVMSIREIIPTGEHVGLLLGQSAGVLIGQGIQPTGAPFTIYHDTEFNDTNLDVEIAFPVAADSPAEIPIDETRALRAQTLPAVAQAASIVHTGDYDSFEQTYAVIGHWIEANGYQIDGPIREIYLRPHSDEEPGISEIQFPVKKG
ncbi:MAG: MerR family transcriptional regulator [Anaerolineae bacterium]|nr:MerR family transcriptional regulator [Anaerolineae bacterium]